VLVLLLDGALLKVLVGAVLVGLSLSLLLYVLLFELEGCV
jgi:hypothetical protein